MESVREPGPRDGAGDPPSPRDGAGDPVAKLEALELPDWRGERVRIGSLWAERPVVLAFLRHFG